MLESVLALEVAFWGVEGSATYFVESDDQLYRLMARDVAFRLSDCSVTNFVCVGDETGFQISYPTQLMDPGFWPDGEGWQIGDFEYRVIGVDHAYGPSQARIFTLTRTAGDNVNYVYQILTNCGLSYVELAPTEIPNLYDHAVNGGAAFYLSTCAGEVN